LVVLAALSVVGGFVQLPADLGNAPLLTHFLQAGSLPAAALAPGGTMGEAPLQIIASVVGLLGIYLAYRWFLARPAEADRMVRTPLGAAVHRFWFAGWGFDWLYDALLVRPYEWTARINKDDFIDSIYAATAWMMRTFHGALSATQTGLLRRYALGIAIGAVIALAMVMLL